MATVVKGLISYVHIVSRMWMQQISWNLKKNSCAYMHAHGWIPPPDVLNCKTLNDSKRGNYLIVSVIRNGRFNLTYVTSFRWCHLTHIMTSKSNFRGNGQNTLFSLVGYALIKISFEVDLIKQWGLAMRSVLFLTLSRSENSEMLKQITLPWSCKSRLIFKVNPPLTLPRPRG